MITNDEDQNIISNVAQSGENGEILSSCSKWKTGSDKIILNNSDK